MLLFCNEFIYSGETGAPSVSFAVFARKPRIINVLKGPAPTIDLLDYMVHLTNLFIEKALKLFSIRSYQEKPICFHIHVLK